MPIYLALLLDCLLGDPKGFPHPVLLLGSLISFYEKLFYPPHPERPTRARGCLFAGAVLLTVAAALLLLLRLLSRWPWLSAGVSVYLLYAALAWRSLQVESGYVIAALSAHNLPKARRQLSYVVGRDTAELTPSQIIKATIETVAENTIDGVLAPFFYMCLGFCWLGLPGAVVLVWLFKAASTMDSLVGYQNPRYQSFGWAAARLDDLLNLLPARLGAALMLLSGAMLGYNAREGWRCWLHDRYAHPSPNSGHPESVMAGLLGLQLGGPAYYAGKLKPKPLIGRRLRDPALTDHAKACRVLNWSMLLAIAGFSLLYLGSLI